MQVLTTSPSISDAVSVASCSADLPAAAARTGALAKNRACSVSGSTSKDFAQGLYRQRSVRDPIVFGQDCFGNDVRTTIQFEEPRGSLEGFPAFGFAVTLWWISRAETRNEHPDSNRVHTDMPETPPYALEPRPQR